MQTIKFKIMKKKYFPKGLIATGIFLTALNGCSQKVYKDILSGYDHSADFKQYQKMIS